MSYTVYNWHLSPTNPIYFEIQNHPGPYVRSLMDIHQSFHLNLFLKGELTSSINGQTCHFQAGDCYLISPWEFHGNTVSPTGFLLYGMTIHPAFLENSLLNGQELLQNFLLAQVDERQKYLNLPETRSLCKQYYRALKRADSLQGSYMKSRQWIATEQFFTEFLDILEQHHFQGSSERLKTYRKLQPILKKIYTVSAHVSLAEAAAECFLSVDYFSHLFKSCFGVSFASFELNHRLTLAASDLKIHALSLKETAVKYGFADKSHFSRCFKKAFGISPGEYQKPDNPGSPPCPLVRHPLPPSA